MKKTLPCLAFVSLFLLSACDNTPKRNGTHAFDHEDENLPTAEEVVYNNIAESEHIEKESAIICHDLITVTEKLTAVNSPDALIDAKKAYTSALASFNKDIANLEGNDKTVLENYKSEAEEAYNKACRDYEIPASGVIANLQNLISRIEKISTKQELYRFQDCRLGMLKGLDDIHLCVEHTSKQIPEIKRLARSLKSKYETKKAELGVK